MAPRRLFSAALSLRTSRLGCYASLGALEPARAQANLMPARQDAPRMQPAPVAVEVTRGDTVESVHRAHVAIADNRGELYASVGDAETVTFLRSAAKPFQAAAVVASGAADRFGLTDRELAVLCGSHAGEPEHVEVVTGIFAKAGLSPDLLRCDTHAFWNKARPGAEKPTPLTHNCSGKHAGMMLLQVHLGADPARYQDPESPAQRLVLRTVAEIAGLREADVRVGVDGCGVPNFAMPLRNAATMFARLAMPRGVAKETADALTRLARAMLQHPDMVGGTTRFDTDLMGASEDRLATKAGAEGVQGVADLATGLGFVLKVEDGATRAVAPATVEALRQLAWLEGRAFEVLGAWWMPDVTNHAGRVVGRVKPVLRLELPRG
jgi:L-asparaginase II